MISPSPQFVALSEKLLPCTKERHCAYQRDNRPQELNPHVPDCPAHYRPAVALALEEQFNAGRKAGPKRVPAPISNHFQQFSKTVPDAKGEGGAVETIKVHLTARFDDGIEDCGVIDWPVP